jgi:hypothetical protein
LHGSVIGNQNINDEDVMRTRNLKWADQNEQHKWIWDKHLSTAGAPTCGTCAVCWASGPSYETYCVECNKDLYKPLQLGGAYIPDSQTFSKTMKKPHKTARAGCTQNKAKRDTTTFNHKDITLQMFDIFDKENARLKDKRENKEYEKTKGDSIQTFLQRLQ